MTTAQLTGRIKLDPSRGSTVSGEWGAFENRAWARAKRRPAGGRLAAGIIQAVTHRMERSDTLSDKLAGYGLCGLAMFYLAGHVLKALFS
jgi:hypothetical protein